MFHQPIRDFNQSPSPPTIPQLSLSKVLLAETSVYGIQQTHAPPPCLSRTPHRLDTRHSTSKVKRRRADPSSIAITFEKIPSSPFPDSMILRPS
jgi:hypothetical protein